MRVEILTNNIAKFDAATQTWVSLGGGLTRASNASVDALALDPDGNLYAGGLFDSAGAVSANNIAMWNGTSWSPLAGGVNSQVFTLLADPTGKVWVGGDFATAGGLTTNGLALWGSNSWSIPANVTAFKYDVPSDTNTTVQALALDTTNQYLYIGGTFENFANNIHNIVRLGLSSSIWSALADGMSTPVEALALDGSSNLYAGGRPNGTTFGNIAKWDGMVWAALGSGVNDSVKSLVFYGGFLYAAGEFTSAGPYTDVNHIAKWFPVLSTWAKLGNGVHDSSPDYFDQANAMVASITGKLYVGGKFESAGEMIVNNIAQWDTTGLTWSAADGGGYGLNVEANSLAVDGSDLIAGGRFTQAGRTYANGVARFNGAGWAKFASGVDYVHALAPVGGGHVYVGGTFTKPIYAQDCIAEWNGIGWAEVGGGISGTNPAVTALAWDAAAGRLYAAGKFTLAGGTSVSNIAMWDGVQWNDLDGGVDGDVYTLALDAGGRLYAGGRFYTAGTAYVRNIAMWDGVKWNALAGGTNYYVYDLAFDSTGRLYVGGEFTMVGNAMTANGIAVWNGYAWSALGSGIGSTFTYQDVGALAVDANDDLYIGGQFDSAGGTPVNQIAMWNGFTWSALGDGLTGPNPGFPVKNLTVLNGRLYVAGYFAKAGNKVSSYIAAYTIPPALPVPGPALTRLLPAAGIQNQPLTLTLKGVNFSSKSVVLWNGLSLPTTYVDSTTLKAEVSAAKTAVLGIYPVKVYTPASSGGGESAFINFTVVEKFLLNLPLIRR